MQSTYLEGSPGSEGPEAPAGPGRPRGPQGAKEEEMWKEPRASADVKRQKGPKRHEETRERREVRWERMLPHQLEAAFAACPAAYFAYGLCEPHGPQNALGLDALKAHALLVRTAQEHGGIVAPPDYWHVHELGGYALWAEREVGEARPWLTAVPPWVHFKNVCYHVRAAEVLGFHAAILLTGHYGPNYQDLETLVGWLQPWTRMRLCGLADFAVNRPGFPGDGADGDHAGKVETSQLWALEPDCVQMDRIPDAPQLPLFGMGRDAAGADLEAGRRMVAAQVAGLGARMRALLAAYDAGRPSRLRTFGDVEELWAAVVRPALPRLKSMRSTWYDKAEPDASSRWRENWPVRGWEG
jgi:creatinine amidohydrolase/Fe(II)-dependent formamide hydrolase-like protein